MNLFNWELPSLIGRPRCLFADTNFRTKYKGYCELCYRSKPDANGGCGPLLSSSGKCLFYPSIPGYGVKGCDRCRPGYALKTAYETCVTTTTIPGCVQEFFNRFNKPSFLGCLNGYAELEGFIGVTKKCIPASQVPIAIKNCLWGGTYRSASYDPLRNMKIPAVASCYRCKPGYSLFASSIESYKPATIRGCLEMRRDGKRCVTCDVYDGYSMQPDFTCLKVGMATRLIRSI